MFRQTQQFTPELSMIYDQISIFKPVRSKTFCAEFEPLIHFYDDAWIKEFIRESQAFNTITIQ